MKNEEKEFRIGMKLPLASLQSSIRDLNQRPFSIWHYTKKELSRAPSCWLVNFFKTSPSSFNPFPFPLPFPFADILFFWFCMYISKITTILKHSRALKIYIIARNSNSIYRAPIVSVSTKFFENIWTNDQNQKWSKTQ